MSNKKSLIKNAKSKIHGNSIFCRHNHIKMEEPELSVSSFLSVPLFKSQINRIQQIICLDDEEQIPESLPSKKIKENEPQEETSSGPMFEGKRLSIQDCLSQLQKDESIKVLRLNHFFKWQGRVYFEVMVGESMEKVYREPQVMSYEELCQNEQTKLLVFHYMASVCKEVATKQDP